jgi:hypothetical protein
MSIMINIINRPVAVIATVSDSPGAPAATRRAA